MHLNFEYFRRLRADLEKHSQRVIARNWRSYQLRMQARRDEAERLNMLQAQDKVKEEEVKKPKKRFQTETGNGILQFPGAPKSLQKYLNFSNQRNTVAKPVFSPNPLFSKRQNFLRSRNDSSKHKKLMVHAATVREEHHQFRTQNTMRQNQPMPIIDSAAANISLISSSQRQMISN